MVYGVYYDPVGQAVYLSIVKRNAPCGVFVTLKSLNQEEMPDGHVLAPSCPADGGVDWR
jgi:hypothetical protein